MKHMDKALATIALTGGFIALLYFTRGACCGSILMIIGLMCIWGSIEVKTE